MRLPQACRGKSISPAARNYSCLPIVHQVKVSREPFHRRGCVRTVMVSQCRSLAVEIQKVALTLRSFENYSSTPLFFHFIFFLIMAQPTSGHVRPSNVVWISVYTWAMRTGLGTTTRTTNNEIQIYMMFPALFP